MNTMAVRTYSDICVAFHQEFSVDASFVFTQLIGAQAGIVLADVSWIRMAAPTYLRNLFAINMAFPSGFLAHGYILIITRGIAAVAAHACQTFL